PRRIRPADLPGNPGSHRKSIVDARRYVQDSPQVSLALDANGNAVVALASLTDAALVYEEPKPAPPAGWACPASFYKDDYCDCGCGLADPDCDAKSCTAADCAGNYSGATASCVYCWGGTSTVGHCPAPPGRLCPSFDLHNSQCDCGCGLPSA